MQNINIYSSGVIFKYALQPPPTHIPLDTNQVSSPFNRGQSIGIAQESFNGMELQLYIYLRWIEKNTFGADVDKNYSFF